MTEKIECLGCRLANQREFVYVVYEDKFVCCFLDHEPYHEGHTLILPKQHYIDVEELDMDTANAVMKASMLISRALKQLYRPDGITVCQNGGYFNELTHYHMHVVPRYKGRSFEYFYSDIPLDNRIEKNRLKETMKQLGAAIAIIK